MSNDDEKDWTIMVYMAGDNNLSENMAFSLADLKTAVNTADEEVKARVNLCAFFDGSSLTAPTKYIDYSPTEDGKNFVQGDPDKLEPFEYNLPGDENTATAKSILNFIRWCVEDRKKKAKNYALIFSGHSFGFHGTSFLRDENSGGSMTLFMFRYALKKASELFFDRKKIAILGFDSCVMSMLEVAYELQGTAQTMVASEGSLPNSGWGYAPLLTDFIEKFDPKEGFEKAGLDIPAGIDFMESPGYIRAAASSFVTNFINHYNELLIGGRSVDIAGWDLDNVGKVVTRVNEFAGLLNSHLDLTDRIEKKQLTDGDIRRHHELKKIILQTQYDAQSYMKNQCVDLIDFCGRFMRECEFVYGGQDHDAFVELHDAAQRIIDDAGKCIMLSGFSGDEYQYSNGMSIYFPWSLLTFTLTNYRYQYLYFVRGEDGSARRPVPEGPGANWYIFLRNYLSRVTLRLVRSDGYVATATGTTPNGNSEGIPTWSKDNPRWTKDNPRWTKDNPRLNRDNPRLTKDNPRLNRGEVGEYLFYFERFKNVQMAWDINGITKHGKNEENEPDQSIT